MNLDDTTTIDTQKEGEDWYLNTLVELSKVAAERGELECFVNTCLRQLSWVAVTRSRPILATVDLFAKLAAQVESDTLYLEEQSAREQAELDAQLIH